MPSNHCIGAVTLKGSKAPFRGFLVMAHVPGEDHMLLGSFIPQNERQQTLNCSFTGASNERESTIVHNNSELLNFQSMILKWRAPSSSNGLVDFRYSISESVCACICTLVCVGGGGGGEGLWKANLDNEHIQYSSNTHFYCRFTVVHNFSTFYAYQRASLNGVSRCE